MKITLPIETYLFQVVRYHKDKRAIEAITELLTDITLVPQEVTEESIIKFAEGFNNPIEIAEIKARLLDWRTRYYLRLRYQPL